MERAVLAYSGGLDTSVAIRWMADHGYEVHAVAVDVGQHEDVTARSSAEASWRARPQVRVVDAVDRFANEFLARAIAANGLYEGKYPMVSGLARPLDRGRGRRGSPARSTRRSSRTGAPARATTRFVSRSRSACSRPISRSSLPSATRDPAREGGRARGGVGHPARERRDRVLRRREPVGSHRRVRRAGRPLGGAARGRVRADRSDRRPSERARRDRDRVRARTCPWRSTARRRRLPELIRSVDSLGGRYGFGRVDMVENRRVGIKSRELYEVPGALAIIAAHRALEDLTLERELAHYKPGIEQRWADLVYDGLWFSPLRAALDAFIGSTQRHVTGDVRLAFSPGACTVVGRRSDASLYDLSLATYGSERRVRPTTRRGVREAVGPAAQGVVGEAGRPPSRAARARRRSGPLWAGRFSTAAGARGGGAGPEPRVRRPARAARRRRLHRARSFARGRGAPDGRRHRLAGEDAAEVGDEIADGTFEFDRPTRTCTRRSSAPSRNGSATSGPSCTPGVAATTS